MTATDWTNVATGWKANSEYVERMKAPLTERMLLALDLGLGDRVLELGCGTGALAALLADQVGPTGHVLASDVAPGMVEVASAALAGRSNVVVEELDAAKTDLDGSSFDAVVFRMGLMFVEEPTLAVQEARRVLKPGGRFAAAVWAGPLDNPWLFSVGFAAMTAGIVSGGPPTGPGGLFSLSDPQTLRAVGECAFDSVSVEPVELEVAFADTDAHFAHVSAMAGSLAACIARSDETTKEAVRRGAADASARYLTDDGLLFPAKAWLLTAR
jgi:SAM-dependent methyltransferase